MNINEFEIFIRNQVPKVVGFHPYFEEALRYILESGGKRFRPQLIFSVVEAFDTNLVKNSFYAGFAIEALHTYSLIHDDLPAMDNADFRRGVSTIHKKYDEVTATLVGDALNTLPFEILAKAPFRDDVKIDLIRSLSENGGLNGMIIGQAIDCYFENKPLTIEQVRFLHQHKTGKLIASALEMGGIIVGDKILSKQLFDFGLTLGLLFQIQDDILDKIETDEVAGKPTNHDKNKNSFVTLLGLEDAIKEANIEAQKSLKLLEAFPKNLQLNLEKNLVKYLFRHKK